MQEYIGNDLGCIYFRIGKEKLLVAVEVAGGTENFEFRVIEDENARLNNEYHMLLATHDDKAIVSVTVFNEDDWYNEYDRAFEGKWAFWFNGEEIVATKRW